MPASGRCGGYSDLELFPFAAAPVSAGVLSPNVAIAVIPAPIVRMNLHLRALRIVIALQGMPQYPAVLHTIADEGP